MARIAAVLALMATVATASGSRAASNEAHAVSLDWNAPAICPNASYVIKAVDRILDRAENDPVATIHATVTISESDGVLRLELVVDHDDGTHTTRSLEAKDCAALADSTAVVLAAMVYEEPAPTPAPPAQVVHGESPPPPEVPISAPRPPKPSSFHAFAGAQVDFGSLPGPSVAFVAGVRGARSFLWVDLGAARALERDHATEFGNASFSWWSLSTRVGVRRGWFAAGLGIEVARLTASAPALDQLDGGSFTRVSPLANAMMIVPIASWLAVRVDAAVLAPLRRPRWIIHRPYDPDVPAFTSAAVVWRGGIAAEVRF